LVYAGKHENTNMQLFQTGLVKEQILQSTNIVYSLVLQSQAFCRYIINCKLAQNNKIFLAFS